MREGLHAAIVAKGRSVPRRATCADLSSWGRHRGQEVARASRPCAVSLDTESAPTFGRFPTQSPREVDMKKQLPLVLSAAAVVIAVLGFTAFGQAASKAPPASYALNSAAVNGIHAARVPIPGYLIALNRCGKFPASVGVAG